MDMISGHRTIRRPAILPVVGRTLAWTILVATGIAIAYLAFATPFLAQITPSGRLGAEATVGGMAVWAVALVAPAGLILVGTNRLARILALARGRIPRRSAFQQALASIEGDAIVATGLTLPDGRGVSTLVIGPFGAAVIRELPSATVTRIREGRWELRTDRGWVSLEDPLQRATRDAERVRRWLGHDDADYVVKTYAAVVGRHDGLERTNTCALLEPTQLSGWLATLPPQRSLTPGRREQMLSLVRDAAG